MTMLRGCLIGILCCAATAADDGQAPELQQRLREGDADVAATLGPGDVAGLSDAVDSDDPKTNDVARDALADVCHRLAGTDQREALSRALCDELADRDAHETTTRVYLCEMLGLVGSGEAVTPLYKAMNEINPRLQEAARRAIVRIPDWTATLALIGGLQTSRDELLIGVINGLGERGDPRAARMLAGQLLSPNEEDVRAALAAFARIAHPEVGALILQAVEEDKPGAKQALLDWADTMIDNEMVSPAAKVLLPMVDDDSLTSAQRCQWLNALGRIGGEVPTGFIIRALDEEDPRLRAAAVEACALLPGDDATTTIARKAEAADDALKAPLVEVLGRRGHHMTEAAEKFLVECLDSAEPPVRAAAVNAIGAANVERGFGAIIALLDRPAGPAREAAVRVLAHVPGTFATNQVVYVLRGNPGVKRATLIRILGWRGQEQGFEQILAAAASSERDVRLAGLAAIGDASVSDGFDRLLEALATDDPQQFDVAVKAFDGLKGEAVTKKLVEAYRGAESPQRRASLLRILGRRPCEAVIGVLLEAAKDPVITVREAALMALGRCDEDPRAIETLRDVARNGSQPASGAAIDALFLHAERAGVRGDNVEDSYVELLKLAETSEHRRLALEGVERTVPAERSEVIDVIEPLLEDSSIRALAAEVLAAFVVKLPPEQKDRAVPLLKKIRTLVQDQGIRERVSGRLEELGAAN